MLESTLHTYTHTKFSFIKCSSKKEFDNSEETFQSTQKMLQIKKRHVDM